MKIKKSLSPLKSPKSFDLSVEKKDEEDELVQSKKGVIKMVLDRLMEKA